MSQPEFIGSLEINKKCGGGRIFLFITNITGIKIESNIRRIETI